MTGHMKMRMNIPARMNTFILMCSCLCLTFTGKDILCNASFVWTIRLFLKIYFRKLTQSKMFFFLILNLLISKQSEMNVPFEWGRTCWSVQWKGEVDRIDEQTCLAPFDFDLWPRIVVGKQTVARCLLATCSAVFPFLPQSGHCYCTYFLSGWGSFCLHSQPCV